MAGCRFHFVLFRCFVLFRPVPAFVVLSCRSDVVEKQPNQSSDAASHLKDSRPAREEIEGIVNGLTRFDHGLQVRTTTRIYVRRPRGAVPLNH